MSNKILIAKNGSAGNLKLYSQNYYIYYLQKEITESEVLCDKIRLEFCTPSSNGEVSVKSYYMVDPANVEIMIFDLLKGLLKFKKERGDFNSERMAYLKQKISKEIDKIYIDVAKGIYD